MTAPRPPLALALGGGGMFGIAYGLGVVHGLRDGGVDVEGAPALGTSAGSWVASALATGVDFEAFDALPAPRVPNLRPGLLAGLAQDLFGDARSPLVRATAVSLSAGRRRVLSGRRYRLVDLIAASSAVPGVFAPHLIEGEPFVDGGLRSGTAADRAQGADHLIVVAPLSRAVLFPVGRASDLLIATEARGWRRRHPGGIVTVIRPNREIAGMAGANPMRLFDASAAKVVY
ncbi:MAG: patatin-like phospholipase family protein, partial [Acidimicrobiales bacterium]